MLPQRVQLAGGDLVALDRVRLGMIGAHVLDKAARDRGRQFYRLDGNALDIGVRAAEFSPPSLPLLRARFRKLRT
jgi:hypothetical protein